MKQTRFWPWLVVSTLGCLMPLTVLAQTQPKIITLGADLTPAQRAALVQRLGAVEGTDTFFTVTVDDMRAAMQNILPIPAGYTSVSSTALTCTTPGSGLRVSTENITKVSAAMYATALVTAGVGDADLIVAAPADAQAEGMTGLTGLFKGLESGICGRGTLDPKRRDLAYRQLAVTADLAQATGGDLTQMSDLMLRAQQNLVHAGNTADAAVPSAQSAQHDTGATLPQAQSDELIKLLVDMGQANIDWGTYARGWTIQRISANEVGVAATSDVPGTAATAVAGTAATAVAGTAPAASAVAAAGQVVTGTVASISPLRITGASDAGQLTFDDPAIVVVRNDQPANVRDLQPNDTLTITLNADHHVQRIEAHSAGGTAAGAGVGQTVQGTITRNDNGTLSIQTATGMQELAANAQTVRVRRNGQTAQLSAIQAGDTVIVQRDASGQTIDVTATSTPSGLSRLNLLWCVVPLLLLGLLFLLLRRRKKNAVIMVGPSRTTLIDEDGQRHVVDTDRRK